MSSGRKLGGGRILGNGKGLAPPQTVHASRPSSPFAPSEASSLSMGSQNLSGISPPTPPTPLPPGLGMGLSQNLTANISLGAPSNGPAANTRLVCPICDEEMLTLLQLNRHIDDLHQELPEVQQDEVKTWFDKQVLKAKRFQPLSMINQKLRGLDVFESNDQPLPVAIPNATGPPRPTEIVDPDDLVTKKHWQRSAGNDMCTDPTCGKGLGPINGSINCRRCGKMFCEDHTMYQMKLSRSANHEPVRGFWLRVCETCYKSREGYNDHHGVETDHTVAFAAARKARVERQNLEVARLEKRLTKLTRLLAEAPQEVVSSAGSRLSQVAVLAGQKNSRKSIEQAVVTWEDDASVPKCPFCKQEFGSWTFRRHHCRLCGRVVCADPQTGCSSSVGLTVERHLDGSSEGRDHAEKPLSSSSRNGNSGARINIDVRMCRDCKSTIFSKRDFADSIAHKPPDQRAYETLRQFEWGIRQLVPSFQRALLDLQPVDASSSNKPTHTHAQIQEAAKIRRRLMDSFAKYNMAAHRVRDLKTDSSAQARIQAAIYATASTFLHANMVPLKHVPRMLRLQQLQSSSGHRKLLSGLNGSSHNSPLRNGESAIDGNDGASVAGSEVSTAASALEIEEKDLREGLIVLEEQRFLVQDMVNRARGSRRLEEVAALSKNIEELDKEIEGLRRKVTSVEERWEGLYAQGGDGAS